MIAEVALALVLLVGSGLMLRTVVRVLNTPAGFKPDNVLSMQVQTAGQRFNDAAVFNQYFDQVLDAVRAVPGVESAAATSQLPLSGDFDGYGVHIESQPNPKPETEPSAFRNAVTPGYLETMAIPILRGRSLTAADRADALPVVVINDALARRYWPGKDPLGERIRIGAHDNGPWYTVVGVAGDVRQISLAATQPFAVYLPESQWKFTDGAMSVVMKTRGDPAVVAAAARRAIWSVDRDQPIVRVATMTSLIGASEAQRSFTLTLITAFAIVALVLAGAGLYGVLSGSVTERFAEIGVRAALGASRANIVTMVLRDGLLLTVTGVVVGAVIAFATTQWMASMLVGVSAHDPITFGAVAVLMIAVAGAASWMPAWRAASVDPARTLREG